MEVLDATSLADRLKWEAKEYWLHLEAETPFEKYPAKQHARRVQEKLGVEEGLIYLPGQQAKNNDDSDMPAPFRQLRYFYYLSGCNEPGCHMTYDIQHDTLSLFIPRIDEKRVIWNGRGSTLAEALVRYDVDEVYYSDELADYLADWQHYDRNKGSLYILHGHARSMREHPHWRVDFTSLLPAMNIARMIKDEHEIKLIRKANDISSNAHKIVLANILKFKNEAQVQGLFLDVCVSHQAKEQAYDPIAASGPNAGTLHYDTNNEDFGNRQLMCLDAGCEFELYASDITRTFPLSSSWPSKEAADIYKLVERMQETCIKRLAPGVRYLDLHILAHQIAIDGLLALGILHNGTKEEIYKAGTSKAFFPHGLGHHMGLEVHDVGQAELMSIRRGKHVLDQPPSLYPVNFHLPVYDSKTCYAPVDPQSSHLEEGMVITVEPGIYFSVYALQHFYLPSPIHSKYINVKVLQRYLPVGGVRIEDDLLITSVGYENLTTAPKGDAMLRYIKQGKHNLGLANERKRVSQTMANGDQVPLLRAPGISDVPSQPTMRPIARAATMPAKLEQRDDIDFEPFEGPSLFTNFRTTMTTEEKIQRWQRERDSTFSSRKQPDVACKCKPVCGTDVKEAKHIYMTSGSICPDFVGKTQREHYLPPCKQCTILCETLERLRQNLSLSSPSSPKTKVELDVTSTTPKERLLSRRSNVRRSEQRMDRSSKSQCKPDRMPWQDELAPWHQYAAETNRSTARRQRSTKGAGLVESKDVMMDVTSTPSCQIQQILAESEAVTSNQVSCPPEADGEKTPAAYQKHLEIQVELARRRLVSQNQEVRPTETFSSPSLPPVTPPATGTNALAAFQKQLEILDEQNRRRIALRDLETHMETEKSNPAQRFSISEADRAFQMQMWEEHNKAGNRFKGLSRRIKQFNDEAQRASHTMASGSPKTKEHVQDKEAYEQARRDLEYRRLVPHRMRGSPESGEASRAEE